MEVKPGHASLRCLGRTEMESRLNSFMRANQDGNNVSGLSPASVPAKLTYTFYHQEELCL